MEIHADYITGSTLYSCRFQPDGNVFLSSGASDEVWGAGGNDASNYAVTMTEDGVGGHYSGEFDPSSNIAEGTYQVTVYLQTGGSPADSDTAIYKGEIYWDGTSEITIFTLDSDINILKLSSSKVLNIYGPGE